MAICRCDWSEDECKETDSGGGYSGDLAHSASGRHCYIWNDLDSYVTNHLWKSHDHRMISVKVSLCTKNKVDWLNVEIRTGPLVLEVKWINWIWKNRQWKSHDLEVMADALPSLKNYCRNPDNNPWNITDWFFLVQSKYLCTCDCILRWPATAAIQTTISETSQTGSSSSSTDIPAPATASFEDQQLPQSRRRSSWSVVFHRPRHWSDGILRHPSLWYVYHLSLTSLAKQFFHVVLYMPSSRVL